MLPLFIPRKLTNQGSIDMQRSSPETGGDKLRALASWLDNQREDFVSRFTAEELLKLFTVYRSCEWHITPDDWSERQVRAALKHGTVPRFEKEEEAGLM